MILIIVLPILFLDQVTKYLVSRLFAPYQSMPVINGIFHLTLVHNTGAAFGILKNQIPFFVATSILAVILIAHNLRKNKGKGFSLSNTALSLVLAGALGNLIDRIVFGYVIDFLDFRVWPVFNVADSAITVGAVLLGISLFRESKNS